MSDVETRVRAYSDLDLADAFSLAMRAPEPGLLDALEAELGARKTARASASWLASYQCKSNGDLPSAPGYST